MMFSLISVILAILGLSFLIFIHELGHYWMARRTGMKVETFSIGFGKPIYSWEKDGVKWQIGWLLFGGFVKIAGMNGEGDPYKMPGSFFNKTPWQRIKVAAMGPIVNLVFAIVAFTALWVLGGRVKNFAEFTAKIGWIDPNSELYDFGVRPGDEIVAYNRTPFQSLKDHLYVPMVNPSGVEVYGKEVNYLTNEKYPFRYKITPYPRPNSLDKDILTTGIIYPASFVIYNRTSAGGENPLPEGSPLKSSGLEYGDRIVWIDGEYVFSVPQLTAILNDGKALLTVQRNGETFLRRVPRVLVKEIRLDNEVREELIDWQYEAELNRTKFSNLHTIPYNLTNTGTVENPLRFIDQEFEADIFPVKHLSAVEMPLEPGDRIIAVDGTPVNYSYEILRLLQERRVNIIVQKETRPQDPLPIEQASAEFEKGLMNKEIDRLAASIGVPNGGKRLNNYALLKPVKPKKRKEFFQNEGQSEIAAVIEQSKRQIQTIEDPEKRSTALAVIEKEENQLVIGMPAIQDKKIIYNPGPFQLFVNVFNEIWTTLKALFTGSLNPKWISGPIGIVQMVHDQSMISFKEALFWLGAISLNLGILNLLPIPVLDGGTICLSIFEAVTGRKIPPKTMEKLIIPFAILLIGLFIYLSYNDLLRLLSKVFKL